MQTCKPECVLREHWLAMKQILRVIHNLCWPTMMLIDGLIIYHSRWWWALRFARGPMDAYGVAHGRAASLLGKLCVCMLRCLSGPLGC